MGVIAAWTPSCRLQDGPTVCSCSQCCSPRPHTRYASSGWLWLHLCWRRRMQNPKFDDILCIHTLVQGGAPHAVRHWHPVYYCYFVLPRPWASQVQLLVGPWPGVTWLGYHCVGAQLSESKTEGQVICTCSLVVHSGCTGRQHAMCNMCTCVQF